MVKTSQAPIKRKADTLLTVEIRAAQIL